MRKLGPPEAGTARRLTTAEAKLLGCSDRWLITTDDTGAVFLLRPRTKPWVRIGPEGRPITVWSAALETPARVQQRLRSFWGSRSVFRVSLTDMERIVAAADAALRGRADRKDLEWVAGLLDQ